MALLTNRAARQPISSSDINLIASEVNATSAVASANEIKLASVSYVAPPTGVAATDAANIQAAANAVPASGGVLAFHPGAYVKTGTVTLKAKTKVLGAGRDATSITQQDTSFAFQYLSPIQGAPYEQTGPSFEGFTLMARNAIDLNQSGNFATVFDKQAWLFGVTLRHVYLLGDYPAQTDANRDTTVIPTQATVDAFGIGLRAAKVFNLFIGEGVTISSFGVGARLDGCDIATISNSARFIGNARHVYVFGHDTYGSGFKMYAADILQNRRQGGIFIESAAAWRIRDNYFETSTAAGLYIITQNDSGGRFTDNRITDTTAGNKVLSFAPQYGLVVADNEYEAGSVTNTTEILSTNYVNGHTLAVWRRNAKVPKPNAAQMLPVLATAASVALYDDDANVFVLQGTGTVDNITGGYPGREITLIMLDNGATIRHFGAGSGNIRLAGAASFVGSWDDTLTLIYGGAGYNNVWLEKARTVI